MKIATLISPMAIVAAGVEWYTRGRVYQLCEMGYIWRSLRVFDYAAADFT